MPIKPVTHLEKAIAGTVEPATHLEKVIAEYGGGGGGSVTAAVKDALLDCFENVAWAAEDGQQYYDALEAALYPLDRITAAYTQSGMVYNTDSLDSLKTDLVVTAFYQGGGSKTVTDYTISGTLTVGTSTITVSYGGKTAMFDVIVTKSSIPAGYIEDGLVFYLDGKNIASENEWVDRIGGKSFALTNCTVSNNGVVFNGSSSYGEYNGAVSSDYANETIEVVFTASNISNINSRGILYQPLINGSLGISMYFGYKGVQQPRYALIADGGSHDIYNSVLSLASNRIGGNVERIVVNETAVSAYDNTDYPTNKTGKTYLGCRKTSTSESINSVFDGTVHAIRIYNRKLTEAELQANQQRDVVYYGL